MKTNTRGMNPRTAAPAAVGGGGELFEGERRAHGAAGADKVRRHLLGRPSVYRCGIAVVDKVPLRLMYFVAERVAELSCLFYAGARRNVRRNLHAALAETGRRAGPRLVLSTFRNYARYLVDFGRLASAGKAAVLGELQSIEGTEHIERAMADGRGIIMLTAHLGNWELGGLFFATGDLPVNVLTKRDGLEEVDRIRDSYRRRFNINTIVLGDSPFAALDVMGALRRGEIVAMLVDRSAPEGVEVEFLGRRFVFPTGPIRLARRTGAPLMPGFVVREGEGYRAVAESPIHLTPDGPDDAAAARAILRVFERYIRRYPDQWYNFVPFDAP